MFSFHKPKVYRSSTGCCICKAKSSSSRFTDSRKYEDDFVECFQLPSPRKGEICNACVLLVKRFKRLPPGSDRHWGHVVDARVGPGLKSMTKFKKKREEKDSAAAAVGTATPSEKFLKIMKKKSKKMREAEMMENDMRENSPSLSDEAMECSSPESPMSCHSDMDDNSDPVSSPVPLLIITDATDNQPARSFNHHSRKSRVPVKRKPGPPEQSFLQAGYWKVVKVCCGTVFKGADNELVVDMTRYNPCALHMKKAVRKRAKRIMPLPPILKTWPPVVTLPEVATNSPTEIKETKLFSDNSSDSGYDDCSNLEKLAEVSGIAIKPDISSVKPDLSSVKPDISSVNPDLKKIEGVNVISIDKNVLVVNGIKNNLNSFKPKNSYVLNSSMKSKTIKVSPNKLMKQNNIVIIKQKNSCIVKSQTAISNLSQVQQAAN